MSDKQGTFQPVEDTSEAMYGPRCLLLCGLSVQEQSIVDAIATSLEPGTVGVVVAAESDTGVTVGELLRRQGGTNRGLETSLHRAVVMSGLTQSELHRVIRAYRASGAPKPLWAALTEHSETWRLGDLLSELDEERRAIEERSTSGPNGAREQK